MYGKIKWFNGDKGFGYIHAENYEDHFFHISKVNGYETPKSGDTVQFESLTTKDGRLRAENVVIIKKSPTTSNKQPYYGKPTYATRQPRPGLIGAIVDALSDAPTEILITSQCLKCGGTGHVTGKSDKYVGFQCERCLRHWREIKKSSY